MENLIKKEIRHNVLIITLNRPEKKNALNIEMYGLLIKAIKHGERKSEVHVILIQGTGDAFSSGNDFKDCFAQLSKPWKLFVIPRFLNFLPRIKKPLIFAINGLAMGVGATLPLHGEAIYASSDAIFHYPFVEMGICTEAGSSVLLPQWVGRQHARRLLSGEKINATEAKKIGLVSDIYPKETLYEEAFEHAKKMASFPAKALIHQKRLFRQPYEKALKRAIHAEFFTVAQLLLTSKETMERTLHPKKETR
ncbi:enoyl-CoA hydratase-related protein [Deltaproteobacteria bacterium TL4]